MSMVIVETDLVAPVEPVNAVVVGERRSVLIPAGTLGTVVAIHGDPMGQQAFEIEFLLEEGVFALARISGQDVVRRTQEHVEPRP